MMKPTKLSLKEIDVEKLAIKPRASVSKSSTLNKSNISVLVLDDDPDLREVLTYILKLTFNKVFTAKDVPEALEILQSEQIDVVISDIGMPGINGIQFLERVRALATIVQPRFIFVTGSLDWVDSYEEVIARYGAVVLPKPFKQEVIIAHIEQLLLSA
jgi:two-component system, OmpR family, alkaline phosphatase synthesis response regulator PhoP